MISILRDDIPGKCSIDAIPCNGLIDPREYEQALGGVSPWEMHSLWNNGAPSRSAQKKERRKRVAEKLTSQITDEISALLTQKVPDLSPEVLETIKDEMRAIIELKLAKRK